MPTYRGERIFNSRWGKFFEFSYFLFDSDTFDSFSITIFEDGNFMHCHLSRAFVPTGKNTLRTTRIFCGKSFIAYFFRSKSENGKTPSLLRRIILHLGRVAPWLAAAHRPSCRHGEGRAHGVENYPWHMRRLFVYHLEHRMSAPSCNSECEGGSPHRTVVIPEYFYFISF